MTIKARESLVLSAFIVTAAGLLAFLAGLWLLRPSGLAASAERLPADLGGGSLYITIACIAAAGLYSAAILGILAFKAGKSVSIEIFFFALWSFSLGLELTRGAVPWLLTSGAGIDTLGLTTRVALFGRYLGLTGLFMGSLYAAGLQQERMEFTFGTAILASLFFASIHPLNTSVLETSLIVELGYGKLKRAFEALLLALVAANYLMAWRERKDRSFLVAGAGVLACAGGGIVLRGSPQPAIGILALLAMACGSWLHLKNLYDHYLWR